MLQRPGELGVDVEVEHAVLAAGGDLLDAEAVEAQQPVGLVEAVLALQRRRLERQRRAGLGDRAEGRVIDAPQAEAVVERALAVEDRRRRWCRRRRR